MSVLYHSYHLLFVEIGCVRISIIRCSMFIVYIFTKIISCTVECWLRDTVFFNMIGDELLQ